jgi:hypothetical protein
MEGSCDFLRFFLPFIGHMGIATSMGVIRDFAGPYLVSEDNMAFGKPTKYWQLDYKKAKGGIQGWDAAVTEASEIYKTRMVTESIIRYCLCIIAIMQNPSFHSTIYAGIIVTRT